MSLTDSSFGPEGQKRELLDLRDGPLEKLWGGEGGRSTKKNSCKGKLSEKKFMHAE